MNERRNSIMRRRGIRLSLAGALGLLAVGASFLVAGAGWLFAEDPKTKTFVITTPLVLQAGETLSFTSNMHRSDPYKNVIQEGEPVAQLGGELHVCSGSTGPVAEFEGTLVQGPGPLSNTFETSFTSTAGGCLTLFVRLKARPGVTPLATITIVGPGGETRALVDCLGDELITE